MWTCCGPPLAAVLDVPEGCPCTQRWACVQAPLGSCCLFHWSCCADFGNLEFYIFNKPFSDEIVYYWARIVILCSGWNNTFSDVMSSIWHVTIIGPSCPLIPQNKFTLHHWYHIIQGFKFRELIFMEQCFCSDGSYWFYVQVGNSLSFIYLYIY